MLKMTISEWLTSHDAGESVIRRLVVLPAMTITAFRYVPGDKLWFVAAVFMLYVLVLCRKLVAMVYARLAGSDSQHRRLRAIGLSVLVWTAFCAIVLACAMAALKACIPLTAMLPLWAVPAAFIVVYGLCIGRRTTQHFTEA